jgi:hypothetical protein
MPRTPAKITQADIARGLRAMKQAGYEPEVIFELGGAVVLRPRHDGGQLDKATELDNTQRPRL